MNYELTDTERAEVRAQFLEDMKKEAKKKYYEELREDYLRKQGYECICSIHPDGYCDIHG